MMESTWGPAKVAALCGGVMFFVALSAPVTAQGVDLATMVRAGGVIYNEHCAVCHAARGTGTGGGPPLAGNNYLESRTAVVNQILWGDSDHGMPAFGDHLTDQEIAEVATFVRNSWSNKFGPVVAESVAMRR